MKRIKLRASLLLLILNTTYSSDQHSVSWSTQLVDFKNSNNWKIIYLHNTSDSKLSIQIKIKKIKSKNNVTLKQEIIAHPKSFVIQAKEKKQIRIFRRDKNNSLDKLYYIYPEISSPKDIIKYDYETEDNKVLVVFRPKILRPDIQTIRQKNYLKIINAGNTTAKLDNIVHCEEECIQYNNKILFPGDEYIVELKLNRGKISLSKIIHDNAQELIV